MTKIIFSHGFGVRADARGMFTEISANFPGYECEMFDYNHILENGDIEVVPLDAQAKKLQGILDKQEDEVILIAHLEDEVLGLTEVNKIKNATHIDIEADHDFTGLGRPRLLNILASDLKELG